VRVHRLDASVPSDPQRRAQEAQRDEPARRRAWRARGELAEKLNVLARGERAFGRQPLARHGVELELGWIDPDVHAIQVTQFAELSAGERGLSGPAATEYNDLPDAALT
jgi:hypothetical protein